MAGSIWVPTEINDDPANSASISYGPFGGSTAVRPASGFNIAASIAANNIIYLQFPRIPSALPSGTPTFRGSMFATATTGVTKFNLAYKSYTDGDNPWTLTLGTAEGTQTTTWTVADVLKSLSFVMDAETIDADKPLIVQLTAETSGWTLAAAVALRHLAIHFE